MTQLWVVPIEIWLFLGKDSQVELVGQRVILPGATFEKRFPVVGRQSSLDAIAKLSSSFVPDVPVLLLARHWSVSQES